MFAVSYIKYFCVLLSLSILLLFGFKQAETQTLASFDAALAIPSACNSMNYWDYELSKFKQSQPEVFDAKISEHVLKYNNFGSTIVHFPSGSKYVYRSSFLTGNQPCLHQLVTENGVKSIVNLYSGKLGSQHDLALSEKSMFQESGGEFYINVLNYDYDLKKQSKAAIFQKVASIIKRIESAPGNVLIHCYGGMHRTGVVYGVMQKCMNRIPVDAVIDEYKKHVVYEQEDRKGGYNPDNEQVIREFPCDLL